MRRRLNKTKKIYKKSWIIYSKKNRLRKRKVKKITKIKKSRNLMLRRKLRRGVSNFLLGI